MLAPAGMTTSLNRNLNASAKVCSRPKGPTTLGPRRICTAAQILRSARMTKATDSISTRQIEHDEHGLAEEPGPAIGQARDACEEAWISAIAYSAAILAAPCTKFAAAFGHGLAGARDRVGEVVIGDRRAPAARRVQRPAAPIASQIAAIGAGMRPAPRRMSAKCGASAIDRRAQRVAVVVGQPLAQHVGQRAQDRPILLRLARREGGAVGRAAPGLRN